MNSFLLSLAHDSIDCLGCGGSKDGRIYLCNDCWISSDARSYADQLARANSWLIDTLKERQHERSKREATA